MRNLLAKSRKIRNPKSQNRARSRRGMLLVVVLVVIAALAVLGASFSYWMHADLSVVDGLRTRQQARLAAESGLTRVMLLLRDKRIDMDNWYNNRDALRRILVWSPQKVGGSESLADQEKIEGQPAWRFSVVATEWDGDRPKMRYGLTDEPSKLNLNTATREQLLTLFGELKLRDVTPEQLTNALIDWRDSDSDATAPSGAESSYYMTLEPPYRAKNKPLDTVEELLTVRYFNGRILYGEDYNRNGYLDPNEDDGPEGLFPPDDGDGVLDRGLLPLVTVYSWDVNSANDNKPRLNINAYKFTTVEKLPESMQEWFSPELVDFLAKAQKRGYKFRSVGELLGLQVWEDGSSNYDDAWKEYTAARKLANKPPGEKETQPADGTEGTGGTDGEGGTGGTGGSGGTGGTSGGGGTGGTGGDATGKDGETGEGDTGGKDATDGKGTGTDKKPGTGGEVTGPRGSGQDARRRPPKEGADGKKPPIRPDNGRDRKRRDGNDEAGVDSQSPNDGATTDNPQDTEAQGTDRRARDKQKKRQQRTIAKADGTEEEGAVTGSRQGGETTGGTADEGTEGKKGTEAGEDAKEGAGESGDGAAKEGDTGKEGDGGEEGEGDKAGDGDKEGDKSGGGTGGTKKQKGTPVESPVTADQMAMLLDRLTVATTPIQQGLVNVNTASLPVLKAIPGLTEEEAQAIASRRVQVGGEEKSTTAWLVTAGVLEPAKYAVTCNSMTARAIQFTVDVVGFADHVGAVQRIQAVLEMQGQLAQIKYYRDVTGLGVGYPLDGDQRSEAFEFDDDR